MPLLKKRPFGKKTKEMDVLESEQYIDLGAMDFKDAPTTIGTESSIKIAEIGRYEDLEPLTDLIYKRNILIIDYTAVSNDELAFRRITNELKSIMKDTKGDMAAIGKNFLIVTPKGIAIDRNKIRSGA